MSFEEFFQKKRIDLTALQAGEPALFFEFKNHFEQMGEKSFDHTKKYWFNKLRLLYHLAPEQKPEKVHIENKLAEQTIVESLTENIPTPSPKVGFKPRFNSGVANADNDTPRALTPEAPGQPAEETTDNTAKVEAPKLAFKPRFNSKITAAKPDEADGPDTPEEKVTAIKPEGTPGETMAAKPAFKPRFNMKMAAPKPAEQAESEKPAKGETAEPKAESPESTLSKTTGFKPRFNIKMVQPKPADEELAAPQQVDEAGAAPVVEQPLQVEAPSQEAAEDKPKPAGSKPRFNAAKMKPKPPQE